MKKSHCECLCVCWVCVNGVSTKRLTALAERQQVATSACPCLFCVYSKKSVCVCWKGCSTGVHSAQPKCSQKKMHTQLTPFLMFYFIYLFFSLHQHFAKEMHLPEPCMQNRLLYVQNRYLYSRGHNSDQVKTLKHKSQYQPRGFTW